MATRSKCELIAPEGGWIERMWYVVDVSYRHGNPIHKSLFYTGFLDDKDGTPAGYNGLVPLNGPSFEEMPKMWNQVRYLKGLYPVCNSDGETSEKRNDR